ncbi:MAG: metallophosphatase family protein [Bacteroidales bacterium]|jgi:putative phosphoesterase|nr:metallophosphatase family protein [Bacteroidales bacterium]
MKIGIISDTHSVLHPNVFNFFEPCHEIWHAGDIGNEEILTQLEIFRPLKAVYGNIDNATLRTKLHEHLCFNQSGLQILLMHIGGYPPKYNTHSKELIEQYHPDIFVCGHSHILKVMYDKKYKLLYINPGAGGNYGFHKAITFLRFDIENQKPANMEVFHEDRK